MTGSKDWGTEPALTGRETGLSSVRAGGQSASAPHSRGLQSHGLVFAYGVALLLLTVPAYAQMPNATDAGPDVPRAASTAPSLPPAVSLPPSAIPKLPEVDIQYGSKSGPIDRPHLETVRITYGGELTLQADQADADLPAGRYQLLGHVAAHEADTTIRAETIHFNGRTQRADATEALLTRSVFSIRTPRLAGTPELLTAYDASLTTVPNGGPADYYLRSRTITLDSRIHRGTLRHVTLYLFGARLLTVPRVTFGLGGTGGGARRQVAVPVFGVSSRYGTFLSFGSRTTLGPVPVQYRLLLPTRQSVEATVTSRQTLYSPAVRLLPSAPRSTAAPSGPVTLLDRLRNAATAPRTGLPEGDPLRFEDFLPEPNPIHLFDPISHGGIGLSEALGVHVAASGNRRTDLYVSRLPEVTLSGEVPLSPVPAAVHESDPTAFRADLRHLVLYAAAQETVGSYREQLSEEPYNIRARRAQSEVSVNARPLLIGPNTVLLPSLSVWSNSYSGQKSAYRYDQVNIAVNHYFSDLTAVGVQFLVSTTSGSSPFDFDVLDTTRELDLRFQLGNRHLITAGRIRYDLARGGVIDYQAALAPALRGFIPVFSYNFRTRSLGLGIEVQGVTF